MKSLVLMIAVVTAGTAAGDEFPSYSPPRPITSGPKEHLFASYYAINAWSADGRYAMVLETDIKNRLPTEADVAVLGVVDTQDDNRFLPLTETRCWNFQEATMAHWLGTAPQTQFIFNDLVDGKFVAVIFDMTTKARRVVPYPVSAVSPDGKWAVSINYARLRLTRPDYGYGGNGQDARTAVTWPADTTNYVLEVADALSSTNWTTVTNAPVWLDGQPTLITNPEMPPRFFRMRYVLATNSWYRIA